MTAALFDAIALLGAAGGRLLVATCARDGAPHVAGGDEMEVDGSGRVLVTGWFCHATVTNLESNRRIAVLALDAAGSGFQLTGRVAGIDDLTMLDGWTQQLEHRPPVPQVRRRLRVDVDEVLRYRSGPHTDERCGPPR